MKTKFFFIIVVLCILAGASRGWPHKMSKRRKPVASNGRNVLYYTCSMHPWVRESKPGPCPVCGMNLTPVYANDGGGGRATNSSTPAGEITQEPDNISTIHVQTVAVERRPVRRTLHLSGEIVDNSRNSAWFAFTQFMSAIWNG